MRKNKLFKLQILLISLILILQVFFPIVSKAKEKDVPTITVSREKIDNTNILTITDIKAKITNVRIVYGEKIKESKYFLDEERNIIENKGQQLEFTTISEKDGIHEIQTSFDIKDNCYEYTIFVFDQDKNAFLYNYSITENTLKIIDVTSSEENKKELTIKVLDTASNITKIKIMKVSSAEEQVDFETQGTVIGENYNKKEVVEKYIVPEDGIYKIYAENEQNSGFVWTQRVYSENPINIEWKQNEEQKNKLDIKVQDKLFDIACVKIAKYEINKEIDWEKAETIYPNEQENNLENLSYAVSEEGKYSIYVEDTQGFKYTRTTSRIYVSDENKPNIKVYINKEKPNVVNIVATDKMYKIKEMNVAVGENLNIDEIQEKAIKLDITPNNIVEAMYPIQQEKTIYIYCVSEDNQAFIFEVDFKAIEIVGEENKPEENKPEENKPEENKPEENKPEENKPEENKPEENKPEENKPEENKPEENKPGENKPEENKPEENKPEENKPEENKPEENKPGENKPEENKPEGNKPEENKPGENKPEENKPEENKPEGNKPEENKPGENKPEENKPEENKPEENKPEENKPEENKPEENNPEKNNTVTNNKTNTTNKTNATKTEMKDSTTSNKPLPKTGIGIGLILGIIILIINSSLALRKYLICK